MGQKRGLISVLFSQINYFELQITKLQKISCCSEIESSTAETGNLVLNFG